MVQSGNISIQEFVSGIKKLTRVLHTQQLCQKIIFFICHNLSMCLICTYKIVPVICDGRVISPSMSLRLVKQWQCPDSICDVLLGIPTIIIANITYVGSIYLFILNVHLYAALSWGNKMIIVAFKKYPDTFSFPQHIKISHNTCR